MELSDAVYVACRVMAWTYPSTSPVSKPLALRLPIRYPLIHPQPQSAFVPCKLAATVAGKHTRNTHCCKVPPRLQSLTITDLLLVEETAVDNQTKQDAS